MRISDWSSDVCSSDLASGIRATQRASAALPSSASATSNDRPSRILRATMRTTLESSTTRQVVMSPSVISYLRSGRFAGTDAAEHPADVQNQQELPVQEMVAGADPDPGTAEHAPSRRQRLGGQGQP